MLQISSYWREGDEIIASLAPAPTFAHLKAARARHGRQAVQAVAESVLAEILPKRLAQDIVEAEGVRANLADCSDKVLASIDEAVNRWRLKPNGTEGWRTAEVTLGGIDTSSLDQQTWR